MQKLNPPYFHFPSIPSLGTVTFEPLTTSNFQRLYLMFEGDMAPFTDYRFRSYEESYKYAAEMERYGTTSPKHGGQDWLVKEDEDYIGILHLYDLSLENWHDNDKRCWIGFATHPERRRQGITKKVILHFMKYIRDAFPHMRYVHARTLIQNIASRATLIATGFKEDEEEYDLKTHVFYKLKLETIQLTAGRSKVL